MTLYLRLVIAALMAGGLGFSHLTAYRSGKHSAQEACAQQMRTIQQAAEAQAERNRDMQRAAELRYVVTREAQDRFRVVTVKEIHEEAAPLASCPVPRSVRMRLNAAAACARGDSAATGCAPDEVPHP